MSKKQTIRQLKETVSHAALEKPLLDYAAARGLSVVDADTDVETGKSATRLQLLEQLRADESYLYACFTGLDLNGDALDLPRPKFEDMLTTADAPIALKRVIDTVLREPKEPNLWLMNSIAEVLVLDPASGETIEFPTVAALQATEIAHGMEYPSATLAFGEENTVIKLRKTALMTAITEEMIKASMWSLIALSMRLLGAAVNRRGEKRLSNAMEGAARVVFDNNSTTIGHTTGRSEADADNGSFSFFDLVTMCGVIVGNRYNPTHMITHPLAWPIMAQDPYLMAQFFTQGQIGGGIWNRKPEFDQSAVMPLGMTYVPYYNVNYTPNKTLTSSLSGAGASLTSDVFVIDKDNSLFLATYGDVEMDQFEDWLRDATLMKARRYMGVAAKDGGNGMARAKDVRITRNFEAIMSVRMFA